MLAALLQGSSFEVTRTVKGRRRFLLVVLVAVAVIGAAGFCLVDAEYDGPELCNGLLGVTVAALVAFILGSVARVGPGADPAYALSAFDPAAPPPRA